tara:strand:+ start:2285 stop:3247 length:963 start_codon:yes stop_codon:yes gene_type:complete
MKKLLICFLLGPILISAQQPFGKDATWHFTYAEIPYYGFLEISYSSDTIMKGLNWQKFRVAGLSEVRIGPLPGDILQDTVNRDPIYLHSRNDSVFRMLPDTSAQLLFDFSTQIGDSWQYDQFRPQDTSFSECYDPPIATVLDIGFDTINGQIAQYWLVESTKDTIITPWDTTYRCSSPSCLNGKIYRDFGLLFYRALFTPVPNYCGSNFIDWLHSFNLRCFTSTNLSLNFTSQDCDYWSRIGIDEIEISPLEIYPNPSNGTVFIETDLSIEKIVVIDSRGRKLSESTASKSIHLPPQSGLYFLSIQIKDQPLRLERIIKE